MANLNWAPLPSVMRMQMEDWPLAFGRRKKAVLKVNHVPTYVLTSAVEGLDSISGFFVISPCNTCQH